MQRAERPTVLHDFELTRVLHDVFGLSREVDDGRFVKGSPFLWYRPEGNSTTHVIITQDLELAAEIVLHPEADCAINWTANLDEPSRGDVDRVGQALESFFARHGVLPHDQSERMV